MQYKFFSKIERYEPGCRHDQHENHWIEQSQVNYDRQGQREYEAQAHDEKRVVHGLQTVEFKLRFEHLCSRGQLEEY